MEPIEEMPVYLKGLALKYYRGIGPTTQYIRGLSEVNFFIGGNNAGKSTVLNFLHERLPTSPKTKGLNLEAGSVENYRGEKTGNLRAAIGIPEQHFYLSLEKRIPVKRQTQIGLGTALREITSSLSEDGYVWLEKERTGKGFTYLCNSEIQSLKDKFERRIWSILWTELTDYTGGASVDKWFLDTIEAFLKAQQFSTPTVQLIPAKRQLGVRDQSFDDLSGKGLIDRLAEVQNPDHHERELEEVFNSINLFLRSVLGKQDARLEVPSNRNHLLVHLDNKVLPLSSLGSGVHEVILIAAFCTIYQEQIMCIEEPEIHLHPVLQRKLIEYLRLQTVNQYFIATHSAAFIDTPGASIFHVRNNGIQTYIDEAVIPGQKRRIVDELGYRASDIVQSNAIVWVEGPSDRIYLKHWLHATAPDLKEGIDFSIMFYGGSLLRHLSADDDATEDFIALQKLNRNMVMIIDSDKSSAQARLKKTVIRLRDEFSKGDGLVWITKGREIENYIKPDVLHEAIKEVHTQIYKGPVDIGQYANSFYFQRKSAGKDGSMIFKTTDKVGVATKVCSRAAELDVLDLKARVQEIVRMIRQASDPST